jgi:hypothetical protein
VGNGEEVTIAKLRAAEEIVKVRALDVPPPGPGLKTLTVADPGSAISLAGIAAFSCELPLNVVSWFLPFHCTVEIPSTKFDPKRVRVKPAPPAVDLLGLSVVIMGTGLVTVITNSFAVFFGTCWALSVTCKVK